MTLRIDQIVLDDVLRRARDYDVARHGPAGQLFIDFGSTSRRVGEALVHGIYWNLYYQFQEAIESALTMAVEDTLDRVNHEILERASTLLAIQAAEKEAKERQVVQ